jgi:hypothetical protein
VSIPFSICSFGLSPDAFISRRIVRYDYGVILCIPHTLPLCAFAKTRADANGRLWATDVVYRLVKKGTSVASTRLSHETYTARIYPVDSTVNSVLVKFTQTTKDTTVPGDKSRITLCRNVEDFPPGSLSVPVNAAGETTTVFLSRAEIIAQVHVPLLPSSQSDDRSIVVEFIFGETENRAFVTSSTGEEFNCPIQYLADRPFGVAGATASSGRGIDHEEDPVPPVSAIQICRHAAVSDTMTSAASSVSSSGGSASLQQTAYSTCLSPVSAGAARPPAPLTPVAAIWSSLAPTASLGSDTSAHGVSFAGSSDQAGAHLGRGPSSGHGKSVSTYAGPIASQGQARSAGFSGAVSAHSTTLSGLGGSTGAPLAATLSSSNSGVCPSAAGGAPTQTARPQSQTQVVQGRRRR